ncbi:MAG: YeeE/YedE family protein [Gammaproteobacteria bacterium]|nr:MAG: YeeE/YedE family protein [Gammaproteobacteria bacterium]
MEIHWKILLLGFGIAAIMGAVANKTNFCTMGAVSDWVNMGDTGRLRAWMFAMALAIIGVLLLQWSGRVAPDLAVSGSDSFPPYRTPMFAWPRYVLGGLLFGIGMTLGSGCGNKTFLRIGAGNLKSVVVLVMMAIFAYLMMYTDFMATVFLSWMQPLFIDLSAQGIHSQSVDDLLAAAAGLENPMTLRYAIGGLLALLVVIWALRSEDFRGRFDNILGGTVVGLAIVGGWYVTAGPMGQSWLEEAEFMDQPPLHAAAQSYTFVSPSGDLIHWGAGSFSTLLVSFGMMAAAGVLVGSFVYAVVFRKFRIEWFSSGKDFLRHAIGGMLMGLGGVLGMGCTFGQGITGASTLALGSFIDLAFIILGSALTMKVEYYKLVYEDEASFGKALISALADLRLVPNSLRKLEAV